MLQKKKKVYWADKFSKDALRKLHYVWLYCRNNKFNKNQKYRNERYDFKQLIGWTNSERFEFRYVCIPNFIKQGQIAQRIIPWARKIIINLTCMYIKVIISYSFKIEFAIIKSKPSAVAAILEITQNTLHVVFAQIQILHFNTCSIKIYTDLICLNAHKLR